VGNHAWHPGKFRDHESCDEAPELDPEEKTIRASEQNEADRAAWREQAKELDASKLVFIDECGSNIALTRLYSRSPKGERAYGTVPRNRRANITLLASLSLQGMGEAFNLEGSADSAVFELYIEQILAPSLQAGQIVILDNLQTHTADKVRLAIEARGCQLLFLPSYSPDLSPIEEAFSKLKAVLRQVGARTPEALQEAIGQALLTITAHDALGWFTHCGYRPNPQGSFPAPGMRNERGAHPGGHASSSGGNCSAQRAGMTTLATGAVQTLFHLLEQRLSEMMPMCCTLVALAVPPVGVAERPAYQDSTYYTIPQ
jgi:transposase